MSALDVAQPGFEPQVGQASPSCGSFLFTTIGDPQRRFFNWNQVRIFPLYAYVFAASLPHTDMGAPCAGVVIVAAAVVVVVAAAAEEEEEEEGRGRRSWPWPCVVRRHVRVSGMPGPYSECLQPRHG